MKKVIALGAVVAFALSATPALAWHWNSGSDITVSNTGDTNITNTVTTQASTGSNTANGGNKGGNGGVIVTGDAGALASVENVVNSNDVKIKKNCGCKGDITVKNTGDTNITNTVTTQASTGSNTANGGNGSSHSWWHSSTGGDGGTIVTGDAGAGSSVGNYVNTNIVRIR